MSTGLFTLPDNAGNGTSPLDGRNVLGALFGSNGLQAFMGGTIATSASGMSVTVAKSVWRIPDPANSGATFLVPSAATTLTIAAASASGSRVDTVAIKQDDYGNGDPDSLASLKVFPGAAGSSTPGSPTAGYWTIATVTIPASVTNTSSCTVSYVTPPATVIPPALRIDTLQHLNMLTPAMGQQAVVYADSNASNNGRYGSMDGTSWVPDFTSATFPITASGWNAGSSWGESCVARIGRLCIFSLSTFGPAQQNLMLGTLPAGFRPLNSGAYSALRNGWIPDSMTIEMNGYVTIGRAGTNVTEYYAQCSYIAA